MNPDLTLRCGQCSHQWQRKSPLPTQCPKCRAHDLYNQEGKRQNNDCYKCPIYAERKAPMAVPSVAAFLEKHDVPVACLKCIHNPLMYEQVFPEYKPDTTRETIYYECKVCGFITKYMVNRAIHNGRYHICLNCFEAELTPDMEISHEQAVYIIDHQRALKDWVKWVEQPVPKQPPLTPDEQAEQDRFYKTCIKQDDNEKEDNDGNVED